MTKIEAKAVLNSKPFDTGIDRMVGKVSGFQSKLGGLKKAIGGAFVVGSVVRFANQTLNAADEIDNLAKQSGLSIEGVQALKIAAEELGVGFEGLRPTINQFRRALDNAESGNVSAKQAFKDLGIEMSDLKGLNVEQALGLVTRKMYEGAESAQVMAASQKVLGAESTRVQSILMEYGRVGIGGLIDQYKDLIRTQEEVIAADRLQELQERNARRISARAGGILAKGIATIELLARAATPGGKSAEELDKEIFGDPEGQAKLMQDILKRRRELSRKLEEVRAEEQITEINQMRIRLGMTPEERREADIKKLHKLYGELNEEATATGRLDIVKQIYEIESQIAKTKKDAKDKELSGDALSGDALRRIGGASFSETSYLTGQFGPFRSEDKRLTKSQVDLLRKSNETLRLIYEKKGSSFL